MDSFFIDDEDNEVSTKGLIGKIEFNKQGYRRAFAQLSDVYDANSYSTTETLTGGTWIDGKPIYRKVFENILISSASPIIEDAEYSRIIDAEIEGDAGDFIKHNSIVEIIGGYRRYYVEISPSNSLGGYYFDMTSFNNGTSSTIKNARNVIVEYTKSTDVAP